MPFDEENGFSAVARTDKGKEIRVRRDTKGYYYIVFNPGGELPREFKSKFTNYEQALSSVKSYMHRNG